MKHLYPSQESEFSQLEFPLLSCLFSFELVGQIVLFQLKENTENALKKVLFFLLNSSIRNWKRKRAFLQEITEVSISTLLGMDKQQEFLTLCVGKLFCAFLLYCVVWELGKPSYGGCLTQS